MSGLRDGVRLYRMVKTAVQQGRSE